MCGTGWWLWHGYSDYVGLTNEDGSDLKTNKMIARSYHGLGWIIVNIAHCDTITATYLYRVSQNYNRHLLFAHKSAAKLEKLSAVAYYC